MDRFFVFECVILSRK